MKNLFWTLFYAPSGGLPRNHVSAPGEKYSGTRDTPARPFHRGFRISWLRYFRLVPRRALMISLP